MERIGGETMVLYADLRERLEAYDAMRSISTLTGNVTTKVLGGWVTRATAGYGEASGMFGAIALVQELQGMPRSRKEPNV